MTDLVQENGRISGVATENLRTGEARTFRASAVILATGGFQSNLEMVREFWPQDLKFPDRLLFSAGFNARFVIENSPEGGELLIHNGWKAVARTGRFIDETPALGIDPDGNGAAARQPSIGSLMAGMGNSSGIIPLMIHVMEHSSSLPGQFVSGTDGVEACTEEKPIGKFQVLGPEFSNHRLLFNRTSTLH